MALILCTEKGRGERAHSARLGAWSDDHTKQGRELGEGEREPVTRLQARHPQSAAAAQQGLRLMANE